MELGGASHSFRLFSWYSCIDKESFTTPTLSTYRAVSVNGKPCKFQLGVPRPEDGCPTLNRVILQVGSRRNFWTKVFCSCRHTNLYGGCDLLLSGFVVLPKPWRKPEDAWSLRLYCWPVIARSYSCLWNSPEASRTSSLFKSLFPC